jgi:UDP-3-O-[3-hydroxymyristoyl] glucosamine N-acyltransferase
MLGGQVGVAGHIKIGNRVSIAAQSGTSKNLKDDEVVFGSPAIPIKDAMRAAFVYKDLPKLQRDIRRLQKEINHIKK